MRFFMKALLALLLLGTSSSAGTQFDLNVGSRKAIIYAPVNRNKPALVISMHGIGIPASWNQGMMKYEPLADTGNFIVAYPEAEKLTWDLSTDKDLNFILAIIDSMSNRYQIDRNRVYASGFSMGAMMSWYLSCKMPDKIAAIVPGDGYPLSGLSGCSDVRHVPVLQLYGTADSYYGKFKSDFLPSQIDRYGCATTSVQTKPFPIDVDGRNASQLAQPSQSYKDDWGPCNKNGLESSIGMITIVGMVHDWATPDKANANDDPNFKGKPFDVNGTWEAWNFMRTHSLAGDIPVVIVPAHRDTIFNGGFDQGTMGWTINTWGGTAQGSVVNGEYKIEINALGSGNASIQLVQNGIILQQRKSYEVKFDAYASANRTLEGNVEQDVSPWTSYLPALQNFDLTTTRKTYSYSFTMTNATDSNGRISFNAGASTTGLFLDHISIKEIPTPASLNSINSKSGADFFLRLQNAHLNVEVVTGQGNAVSIHVCDLNGIKYRSTSFQTENGTPKSWSFDLSGMPRGVYIVEMSVGMKTAKRSMIHYYN